MSKIIVALDTDSIEKAKEIIDQTCDLVWGYKIGYQLFYGNVFSPEIPKLFSQLPNTFLDLKFHDIPNTIAGAIKSIKPLEPTMFTLHVGGSSDMLKQAVQTRRELWRKPGTGPKIIAVTILTSMSKKNWNNLYPGTTMEAGFSAAMNEAVSGGANGVVCSGWEVEHVKKTYPSLKTIVPGIRPLKVYDDQARIITPREALQRGADYLVIGRPITAADNPRNATRDIIDTF